ncbi:MAG: DUF892 family protein [Bacteriovoracaceae bacterium]|nr:DUF892 family protein [Bacteriovoracaceae bacterium]
MKDKLIKRLTSLHQLDVDAIHAYDEAIKRMENTHVKQKLQEYKHDHEMHLDNLEELIISKGGERPNRKRDMKGMLLEGMTLLRSSMGDEQALKAMKQNEELTNKKYLEALQEFSSDPDCMKVLEHNYADERKHLTFIKETLDYPHHLDSDGPEESHPQM